MRREALCLYACPKCEGALRLEDPSPTPSQDGTVQEGRLHCAHCGSSFPIIRSIPRFVSDDSYAASFGLQWKRFPTLQVDKAMQNDLSRHRFYATTRWPMHLEGERVLEAGCGAGRFTEIVLETGAEVFSFDLSSAVEVAGQNNLAAPRLHLFQASIYQIPLRKGTFDKIFCMGVLQHCPDVKTAFLSLVPYLRPGGEIVIDVYSKNGFLPPLKYWARPLVAWMKPESLLGLLRVSIPVAFDLKNSLNRIPGIGAKLARVVPIGPLSHAPRLNYTEEELKQVKILSAFDMLSPKHDHPQRIEDVEAWFKDAGLSETEIGYGYNGINARGRKPTTVGCVVGPA